MAGSKCVHDWRECCRANLVTIDKEHNLTNSASTIAHGITLHGSRNAYPQSPKLTCPDRRPHVKTQLHAVYMSEHRSRTYQSHVPVLLFLTRHHGVQGENPKPHGIPRKPPEMQSAQGKFVWHAWGNLVVELYPAAQKSAHRPKVPRPAKREASKG